MPVPRRDLEETRARLSEWMEARLPDSRDVRLSDLTGPGMTGFSNDTLLFDVTHREGACERRQALVVRIEPTGFRIFPSYDVPEQARILRCLEPTDVPVPRVLWLEERPEILGAPFYVMERVEGRVPTDNPPYHVDGWMKEVRPTDRESIWWSGLEVLARIHRLDRRAVGLGFLDRGAPGSPLERQLHDYERFLEWAARGRPHPTSEAALAWLWKHRPTGEPTVLSWGDARLGNMIFRETRCVAVLDWEMATVASPEADLGWWLFFDRHHSAGCGVPRLEGFPEPATSVERYERWTGHRVRHLEYYEIFAAFRFSVIMIRVAQQLAEVGLLPPDSEFETNNTCTALLASMLELPPPGEAG